MKRIRYRITYVNTDREPVPVEVTMTAQSINSGFREATRYALQRRHAPPDWTIHSIEFMEVLS